MARTSPDSSRRSEARGRQTTVIGARSRQGIVECATPGESMRAALAVITACGRLAGDDLDDAIKQALDDHRPEYLIAAVGGLAHAFLAYYAESVGQSADEVLTRIGLNVALRH